MPSGANRLIGKKVETDLKVEQDFAQMNYEKLVANMPVQISQREEKAFERITKAKLNPSRKLESLYKMMDEMYQYVQGFTPCRKGCAGCCHIAVTVSEVEIRHIERVTKNKRLKVPLPRERFHGKPCVFLNEGKCSIYTARPYVCRRHTALTKTSHWCDPSRSLEASLPLLKFSSFQSAFEHIRLEDGNKFTSDIRQVFSK